MTCNIQFWNNSECKIWYFISCYSSEWIYYVMKDQVLHFCEEIGEVSLENVKEYKFLSNFPKVRPKQSSVLSPSANKMEGTLR